MCWVVAYVLAGCVLCLVQIQALAGAYVAAASSLAALSLGAAGAALGAVALVRWVLQMSSGLKVGRRWPLMARHGAALLAVAVVPAMISLRVDSAFAEATFERGSVVMAAVERFVQDTGACPESLQDLAPAYLEAVPTTALSLVDAIPFEYQRPDPHRCELWVTRELASGGCVLRMGASDWQCFG